MIIDAPPTNGVVGVTVVAASAAAPVVLDAITMPFLGVPLRVVGMALGGAIASFAYGRRLPDRGRLFFLAIANTFLGCAAVAILPHMFHWEWMRPEFEPPLAGLVAFGLRWAVPAFVTVAPQWFLARSSGGAYGGGGPYGSEYGEYDPPRNNRPGDDR